MKEKEMLKNKIPLEEIELNARLTNGIQLMERPLFESEKKGDETRIEDSNIESLD